MSASRVVTAAVVHQLTEPEAHAICAVLAAVEHIPVDALIAESGLVDLWPGRELSVLEEVTALRGFNAVSDSRLLWHQFGGQ
jgi:hypothetical protein